MKNLVGHRFGKLVALEPTNERKGGSIVWKSQCDCGNVVFVTSRDLRSGRAKNCGCVESEYRVANDLTNKRFGKLVAVEATDERKNGTIVWKCRCDCGNVISVDRYSLVRGDKKSCGCAKGSDLVGQRFGNLVVVEPTIKRYHSSIVWKCQCDCGNFAFVSTIYLKQGITVNCGCQYKKNDLIEKRFGSLVALEPTDERKNGAIVWKCQCDCGNIVYVNRNSLISGCKKSCGCLKFKDLTGQRFGNLVALEMTEKREGGHIVWKCECDCGNVAFVGSGRLMSGGTKNCGCIVKKAVSNRKFDLSGQRFGKLVAIEATNEREYSSVIWKCKCDCGNDAFVSATKLKKGNTQSCGCDTKKNKKNDLTNRRFGKLVALEPTNERKYGFVVWKCRCDCGDIAFIPSGSLKNGNTQSCGCLGKKK